MLHIVGIVGVPGRYGGFETLVDNLIGSKELASKEVVVYCEAACVREVGTLYKGAALRPLRWKANGWQAIIYDGQAMILSALRGADVLILGASAAFLLPVLRALFPRARFLVNMAGLEWQRSKWGPVAKIIIRLNEWASVRFAHRLIADNEGLVEYVKNRYRVEATYIPYGGDQYCNALENTAVFAEWALPRGEYDFAMARAQSDNNLELILEAYENSGRDLVFVSTWDSTEFGRHLKSRFSEKKNLYLVGPIYDLGKIKAIQRRARLYVHGHSAGGTNPALVEAMWAGLATFAYDVSFNRYTTENLALYFSDKNDLRRLLEEYDAEWAVGCGAALSRTAQQKFSWTDVCAAYASLLRGAL